MIKVFLKDVNFCYECSYGYNLILIENKELFRKIYYDKLECFIISEGDCEINSSKINIIDNVLNLELNDKKNITYLNKLIYKYIYENCYQEYRDIIRKMIILLEEASDNIEINYEFNMEEDFNKIAQSFDIKIKNQDFNSIVEEIMNYVVTIGFINRPKLFITFQANMIFTKKELKELNEELKKNQITLLDISTIIDEDASIENKLIIDNDLCII